MVPRVEHLGDEAARYTRGNVPHDLNIISAELLALRGLIDAMLAADNAVATIQIEGNKNE